MLTHSPRIITDGLVLCLDAANKQSYPGSGTVWTDLAGSNNGALTNGVGFNAANKGGLTFDGTNDYVDLTNTNNLNITTGDFSIETFLFYQRSGSQYARAASRGNWEQPGWMLYAGFNGSQDSIGFFFGSPGAGIDVNISQNSYHHVCVTRLNGTIFLYLNTTMVASLVSNYNFNSTFKTVVGASGGGTTEFYKGNIYTFRQYNRALTPAEILQNYNATKGRYNL